MHVYGELAAPPEAAEELARRGVVATGTLEGIPQGDIVIFPAHGVPPAVRAEAVARGLAVVDATCPFVAHAQDQAARLAERGDDVVLIGHPGQRTADAITGCAQRAAVVESAGGTATLQVTDARRVSYLLQPGIPVEWSGPVTGALRSRFPAARGPNPDGFCYAPSDRAQTIKAIAADCELMLVLGDADSADARMLSALARDCGTKTQVIAAVGDLTPAMLAGVSAIGTGPVRVGAVGAGQRGDHRAVRPGPAQRGPPPGQLADHRRAAERAGPDLTGPDLSGPELTGADLTGPDLRAPS